MDKIYLANYHLPILIAFTFISIGCTFNTEIKLPNFKLTKIFEK